MKPPCPLRGLRCFNTVAPVWVVLVVSAPVLVLLRVAVMVVAAATIGRRQLQRRQRLHPWVVCSPSGGGPGLGARA